VSGRIRVVQDQCNARNVVIPIASQNGALAAVSSTGLADVTILDFARSIDGSHTIDSKTLCQVPLVASQCQNITLRDAAFYHSRLIVLADTGLFLAGNEMTRIPSPFNISASNRLSTSMDCASSDGFLYYYHASSSAAYRDRLAIVSTLPDLIRGAWIDGPNSSSIPGVHVGSSFVSATYSHALQVHFILLGTPVPGCCGLSTECCFNSSVLVQWDGLGSASTVHIFDSGARVVGFLAHANQIDLYIYGTLSYFV
jgi:hypothetical protein